MKSRLRGRHPITPSASWAASRSWPNRKLVPAATLENATRSRDLAIGSIAVLELQLDQARAKLGGTADRPVDEHPTVRTAAAALEKAKVDLEHTIVRAPRAGIVSHLPQTGDRVEAGRAAFAIVTDGGVYVEANFKETDLEWVRPGETATVEIDTYPGREWTGKVDEHRAGDRLRVLGAAAAERVGQLGEGRAARAGAHQHRSQGGRPAAAQRRERHVSIDTGPHTRFDRWFGSRH